MRLLDPAILEDPYPVYAQWQEQMPIWRDEESGAWVLTRHDDIRSVLKNSADYSSIAMGQRGGGFPLPLLTDDPLRHTQLRGLVDRAFTVRMLKAIEARVNTLAQQMVGDLPQGEGVDIAQALTIPLPVAVISQMMGIPAERAEDFKRWSDALTGTLAGASIEDQEKDIFEMAAYFQSLIPERRRRPGDDLVSAVVNAEIDGARLSDEDIVGFNILLLIAGNETTTNLLGNYLNVLVDRPDLYAQLTDDPTLIDAGIEETLRFDAPVQFLMRRALKPMHYHGQDVAVGDNVHVIMAAANRDPRNYDAPHEFRLDRKRNHHHTFGFGIHFCIGAPLARMEAKAAMQALVARFSSVERASGKNERVPSHLLRGFHHLWLQFS
ncbi:MAG: cytochrome P450 [Gammaproteobacteria bacterium]|nr:cytochrome P450 [Gammaproteobacteria bacterium]